MNATAEISVTPETEAYERDLRFFCGVDESVAALAFDKLSNRVRDPLTRYLRRYFAAIDDREDIAQTVLQRIWSARRSFEPLGVGAWWSFVKKAADRCAIDQLRRLPSQASLSIEEPAEIPESDLPNVHDAALAAESRLRLRTAIDALWLGPIGDSLESKRKILAAQLHYMHAAEPKAVSTMVGGRVVPQAELDEWLTDESVLRHMAFRLLYWDSQELAMNIIQPERRMSCLEFENLARQAARDSAAHCPKGWNADEVMVVIWRVRYGMMTEQILRLDRCKFDRRGLDAIFARCLDQYPFVRVAHRLKFALRAVRMDRVLSDAGLWRRIVFQYDLDDLPQKQILERTAPAASVVGVNLSEATLNGWLSMGRLWAQVSKFVRQEGY